ncbi:response regulator transcription factor [Gemmiger sp.]
MYKLIMVDDEEKIVGGMAQLFPWQNIGFEVVEVFTSARKALEYIETHPVDVVMNDIEMPDMNGLELSRRLMAYPNIEKVFFSSYSNYEYFRTALQNGVADYLMKPVDYSALLECFEKIRARLDARDHVTEEKPKAYYDQIVYDVQQYLKEHYRTATLEEAAAKVSLSPAYLSRVFKEKSGESFSELLLRTRMEKACELLADIQNRSYDIAYYVGYDNPKNFSRAFKAYYGVSPSEYRKSKVGGAE